MSHTVLIDETIQAIRPLDLTAMEKCQIRLDNLTKPLGSLHAFEHLARKLAGITSNPRPRGLKKSLILMAADHGIACEGISAYSQEVTAQMAEQVASGISAINIFAAHIDAALVLIDIGVAKTLPEGIHIRNEKIAWGTENIASGPAMTRAQAIQAIECGILAARRQIEAGSQIIGLGELGIGNTSASTAIVCSYSALPPAKLTGRGSGISDEVLAKKIKLIEQALTVNQPNNQDPLDVLAKIGGLEIAGLTGVILGAAAGRAAVVLDSLVTSVAALIAFKLAPGSKDYLIGSHYSTEPAHLAALELMEIPAYLHLDMNLGQGTGACLGMSLIKASLHVLNDMKTFGEAEVAVAQDGPGVLRQDKSVRD